MAKTIDELKAQSREVKNATVVGENTATRVGTLFNDIVEHIEQVTADGATTTQKLAPLAVTTAKLADGAVTTAKLADSVKQAITYDVSAHNNGAFFESLQALLSSSDLNTLIPISVRHGGMSIRFIQGSEQGSDNKYVQYRLTSDTFNTTTANWQGVDDEPTAGSDNLVKSGGVADALFQDAKSLTFTDNKSNIDNISYFDNPFKVGNYYKVKNIGNTSCSFIICQDTTIVHNYGAFDPGDSIEIYYEEFVGNKIGGWINDLVYQITVQNITDDKKINIKIEDTSNKKSDKDHVKSDFIYTDGYIHGNANEGVIEDADFKHTSPIYVSKGTKVYAVFTGRGDFSVIAKTDKNGSSYIRLYSQEQTVNSHRVFTYTMTEDCYICISIRKSEGFAYIDTNYSYVSESTYSTKATFVVNGEYSVPFTIKKGHRYLVKNSGNVDCSCIPRIIATGENLYRIKNEPITDGGLSTNMDANSYGIFVAPIDSYYLFGWSQSQTTISIEDISSINAINDEYTSSIYNKCSNIIIQSREGRVSSVQYPNNSKWGIAEAARNQYDRIRFTIRKTTDGYYFLCHNNTINATARNMDGNIISEPVSSEGKTLAELNEYDWGIQCGEKFAGMQVPMLEDALYYASLYNLGVTFEINSSIVEADYENLFNLAVKYGLINNLILVPYNPDLFDYFKTRNKKVSYWWSGTYTEFEQVKDTLKGYLTGENNVYIYNTPYTEYPSSEYLKDIAANGFTPHFSNVFNENDFIETVKKGIVLIDVANVAFVKSTLRRYADSLVI